MSNDEPARPRPIVQLEQDVVNRIAAAEIIHRPSNAIKELLENSLDAGSTSIKITIKEGGLKLIQIADNGHGINRSDLPLLCTRYATSKLREFKDLESIATYGFRGEALASISYCSLVEVVTKTKADSCGWRANYANGVLAPGKAGSSVEPKPSAANDGTIITAEDLFFNMPLRKRAFRSASDEYNRMLDVVTKYAVHNPHSAWVCKKAGSNLPDLSTPVGTTSKANIALLYTHSLAEDLLEVPETVLSPESLTAKVRGWVSNANANWARKGGWLLFINNRLVDSSKIRKAVEAMYTAFLPKGASPWVYLSLQIDPAKVDVNVHPTKSEVHFLNEDEIIDSLVSVVHTALQGANTSRSFTVQTILPGATDPSARPASRTDGSIDDAPRKKAAPNYKIRNDLSTQTLDAMLAPSARGVGSYEADDIEGPRGSKRRRTGGTSREDELDVDDLSAMERVGVDEETLVASKMGSVLKGWKVEESLCEFTSIQELRAAVRKRANTACDMIAKHAFVGIVEEKQNLALVQHGTKLHLINYAHLADQHFYQLGLRQFGALDRLKLDPPPDLRELLEVGLQDEPLEKHGLDLQDVASNLHATLLDKRDMIDEYFSLRITDDGAVESIPMLIRGYVPDLDRLPHLLVCLATRVDWTSEKECFQGVLKELAFFYSPRLLSSDQDEEGETEEEKEEQKQRQEQRLWQLEHVLFPSFRKYTAWPAMGRDAVQVANLPDLFRIFERC